MKKSPQEVESIPDTRMVHIFGRNKICFKENWNPKMEVGKLQNGWELPLKMCHDVPCCAQIWTQTSIVASSRVKTFVVFDIQIFANCMHTQIQILMKH